MPQSQKQKSQIQIDLGSLTINCTIKEIAATFAWLFAEMHAAMPRLRPDEREVLRRIMTAKSGSLTVSDVFPDFTRESEGHKTLRRLRAGQFIRPARTGRWELNEPIELKPFGWLIWNRCGEANLFHDVDESEHSRENGNAADDDVIDLASPEVDQLGPQETIRIEDEEAAEWDNDLLDVLDFSKDRGDNHA